MSLSASARDTFSSVSSVEERASEAESGIGEVIRDDLSDLESWWGCSSGLARDIGMIASLWVLPAVGAELVWVSDASESCEDVKDDVVAVDSLVERDWKAFLMSWLSRVETELVRLSDASEVAAEVAVEDAREPTSEGAGVRSSSLETVFVFDLEGLLIALEIFFFFFPLSSFLFLDFDLGFS